MSVPHAGVSASLLTDQVFNLLRDEIVNGQLPPGSRLRMNDIAERVGTSVMPAREAIHRLEEAGLADRVPHRGAVVRAITLTDLLHIYDVRRLLEVEAAGHGAAAAEDSTVEEMTTAIKRMRSAVDRGDVTASLDQDEQLLRSLYSAHDNQHLTDIVENLWRKCRALKILEAVAAQGNQDLTLWSYQGELVDAARNRDGRAAAAITQESLLSARQRIQDQLSQPGRE